MRSLRRERGSDTKPVYAAKEEVIQNELLTEAFLTLHLAYASNMISSMVYPKVLAYSVGLSKQRNIQRQYCGFIRALLNLNVLISDANAMPNPLSGMPRFLFHFEITEQLTLS